MTASRGSSNLQMGSIFSRLCVELGKQAKTLFKKSAQAAFGLLGVAIISDRHYKSLLAKAANVASKTNPTAAEEQDPIATDKPYYLPQRVPFPVLPGVDAETFNVCVVDVGAQPLSYEEHIYAPLLREGDCHIVGFDPFADPTLSPPESPTPAAGVEASDPRVTILPYCVGNGEKARFHLNAWSPTSSLFPSDLALMSQFSGLTDICTTSSVTDVETRKLDDVREIERCDFLKVDVQGGDFDVIAHGKRLLERTLLIHIETEFSPIYSGQPLFADIDTLLRQQGFELVDLMKFGWNNYAALPSRALRSKLLWADAVYMKNPDDITANGAHLLLRTAYIAHAIYRKYDLAAHLVKLYDTRTNSALHGVYARTIATALNKH